MSKSKHTPGEWITDGGTHVMVLYKPTGGGKPFYHTIARTDQPLVSPEQQGANSILIAAAPRMLELLKLAPLYIHENDGDGETNFCNKIRAVIAEAEGLCPTK